MVAAASFDDAIAITGYTLCINLAVRNSGNPAWSIAHGPLSIVLGIGAGGVAALVASATRLWTSGARRSLVMVFLGAPLVGLEWAARAFVPASAHAWQLHCCPRGCACRPPVHAARSFMCQPVWIHVAVTTESWDH